jgi:hypothetical protein
VEGCAVTRDEPDETGRFSRRSLIATSAGVATTVAVGAAAPAAVAAAAAAPTDPPAVPVATTSAVPANPIVAYVHDAARGEVTIVTGTHERTFRDHALVKRLLAAAAATEAK